MRSEDASRSMFVSYDRENHHNGYRDATNLVCVDCSGLLGLRRFCRVTCSSVPKNVTSLKIRGSETFACQSNGRNHGEPNSTKTLRRSIDLPASPILRAKPSLQILHITLHCNSKLLFYGVIAEYWLITTPKWETERYKRKCCCIAT
jgi:hypothetical protein